MQRGGRSGWDEGVVTESPSGRVDQKVRPANRPKREAGHSTLSLDRIIDEKKRRKRLISKHEIVVGGLWPPVLTEYILAEINRLMVKEAEDQPSPPCGSRFEDYQAASGLQDPRNVSQHIQRPRQVMEDIDHDHIAHAGVGEREPTSICQTVEP